MPDLSSSWHGSTPRGRLYCSYTRVYNALHTAATFDGTLYFETDGACVDPTTGWTVGGGDVGGVLSGSRNVSIGSAGGRVAYKVFNFTKQADGVITTSVDNDPVGVVISATFRLDVGPLAPYLDDAKFVVSSTKTSFTVSSISGSGNGSALVDVQLQYNTSASEVGATLRSRGRYDDTFQVLNVEPGTQYYYRVRLQNADYGLGPWSIWKTVTTQNDVPGAPTAWTFGSITQTGVTVTGLVAPSHGSPITDWEIQYNTTPTDVGATSKAAGNATGVISVTGATPGTTYSARFRAKNALGWGPYSGWSTFKTLPGVAVNVNGVWKNAEPWVNVGGIWKPATRFVNVGGIWKQ